MPPTCSMQHKPITNEPTLECTSSQLRYTLHASVALQQHRLYLLSTVLEHEDDELGRVWQIADLRGRTAIGDLVQGNPQGGKATYTIKQRSDTSVCTAPRSLGAWNKC